jgi:hypothetical protein
MPGYIFAGIAAAYFAAYFVTTRLGLTPHCHHNFGYYCGKYLIRGAVMSDRTGPRYAFESRVVYSR